MKKRMALVCVSLLLGVGAIFAAPLREPHDHPDAPELRPIALDQLPKDGIAAFGNWVIGHTPQENGILVIHRHTRLGIYLPWAADSWVNYRSTEGVSYLLAPRGNPSQMHRDYDIDRLLAKPPQTRIAAGTYKFGNWTVTVAEDRIDFHCSAAMGCRMTVRPGGNTFVFEDRVIGGPK
jgi:hypothetical protein